jgi:hypothetical protein
MENETSQHIPKYFRISHLVASLPQDFGIAVALEVTCGDVVGQSQENIQPHIDEL